MNNKKSINLPNFILIYSSQSKSIFVIESHLVVTESKTLIKLHVKLLTRVCMINDDLYLGSYKFNASLNEVIAKFEAHIDHKSKTIRLGPRTLLGMLPHEFRNCGIGTFCLVQIFNQLRMLNGYVFQTGKLGTPDKSPIRDFFYRNCGANVTVNENGYGNFKFNINALREKWNRKKIKIIQNKAILDLLRSEIDSKAKVKKLDRRLESSLKANDKLIGDIQNYQLVVLSLVVTILDMLMITFEIL